MPILMALARCKEVSELDHGISRLGRSSLGLEESWRKLVSMETIPSTEIEDIDVEHSQSQWIDLRRSMHDC